jgi:two-component system NtrC family sensor kinase
LLNRLSYRIKMPLVVTAVIVITEIAVTAALVSRAFVDARRDLQTSAVSLGRALARSVRDPLARDDIWRTYEAIRTPIAARDPTSPLKDIIVVDTRGDVVAATDPPRFPVTAPLTSLPPAMQAAFHAMSAGQESTFDFPGFRAEHDASAGNRITSEDGSTLGYVLVAYDGQLLYDRIRSSLGEIALISIPGLLILVPLGWLWGDRMAKPLVNLTHAMRRVGTEPAATINPSLPAGGTDEIAQLTEQFERMLSELAEKQSLEREMIVAERLAAVGRVAAGIAHEVNNPLGGMINAVDTLAKHGHPDPLTVKTLGLLERGLNQIRSTIGALLVEAKIGSPVLTLSDWQDLQTLIEPQVANKQINLHWSIDRTAVGVGLPAYLVRQLVLNLLLNATAAAEPGGRVGCSARLEEGALVIEVTNSGERIHPVQMERLFEPFNAAISTIRVGGQGLGLWVTYQIVRQLNGAIKVTSEVDGTLVNVVLPVTAMEAAA